MFFLLAAGLSFIMNLRIFQRQAMKANFDTRPEAIEINLQSSALVIVDMQNAFAAKSGVFDLAGVDISKTVAVGDGLWNDGPMIEAAGCGVAMKNAHKEIISKADPVTEKNNNEDGLGNYLRGLFGI